MISPSSESLLSHAGQLTSTNAVLSLHKDSISQIESSINLLKFTTGNLKSEGKKVATKHLLSKMKQSGTFFNTDKILFKTFLNKIKNPGKDADDILYGMIISDCQKLD